jgi:hypothetical protein
MVAISSSGSGEGLGGVISRGYSTDREPVAIVTIRFAAVTTSVAGV